MVGLTHIRLTYNNVYLVEGEAGRLLVDTGPDYAGAWQAIQGEIVGLPDVVLATHGHLDHAGLGAEWQRHGVPVAMHTADAHLPGCPPLHGEGEMPAFEQFVRDSGAPDRLVETTIGGLRSRFAATVALRRQEHLPAAPGTRWPTALRYEPFEPKVLLEGTQDSVLVGVTVVHCPGHTPGNLVAVWEGEGWLFSGDHLLPEITPTPSIQAARASSNGPWRFRSLPEYLRSMRMLATRGFERCFPGHGEPFGDVNAVILANIAGIEERTEKVRAALRSGGPGTTYAIARRLYPRALERRFWQILATVQGHLDLLEEEGSAALHGTEWALLE